jgi:sugar phosphate isomerase/epimerase
MKFPIALQLYSVRDDMEKDFLGTLKKVKELGYDMVEFAGLFDYSAKEVKEMCKEAGLVPISAHVSCSSMAEDLNVVNDYAEIGCKFVVIPWNDRLPGHEKYDEFKADAEKISERAESLGMKLCYHNHDFEFEKIDGKNKLDIMYEDFSFMYPQIDTCWAKVGGEDPAEYIKKYEGRAEILHLKDFVGQKTNNMYGLIGKDGKKDEGTAQEFDFRPVGHGVQDFKKILASAEEIGIKYVVVEQDRPCLDKTPLECAEMSINYLKSIMD